VPCHFDLLVSELSSGPFDGGAAAEFPAAIAFTVTTGEILGGLVMLAGVAVATLSRGNRVGRRNPATPNS